MMHASEGRLAASVMRLALRQPINTPSGVLGELEVRVPTWGDALDIGPITRIFTAEPHQIHPMMRAEVVPDVHRLARWASRLTGQQKDVILQLAPADAAALFEAVRAALVPLDAAVIELCVVQSEVSG